MKRIRFSFAVCLLALARVCLGDVEGCLLGFDAESRAYLRKEKARLDALNEEDLRASRQGADHPSLGEAHYEMHWTLQFLMPFCSDLRSYERDTSTKEYDERRAGVMRRTAQILRPEWLPAAWSDSDVRDAEASGRRQRHGRYHDYWRVPGEVFPIFTWPGKAPTLFSAFEMRKGSFAFTSLTSPWLYLVFVLHEDQGFGVAAPAPEQLAGIRDRYVRLPPEDLTLPKGWSSVFEVDRRDGRFCMGRMVGLVNGKRLDKAFTPGGTWVHSGGFFYDGFNLAFWVTGWSGGVADESPQLAPPDFDWSKPPYNK